MSWLKRALLLGLCVLIGTVIFPMSAVQAGGVVTNCTQTGLVAALAGGGTVTFNCGTATITLAAELVINQNTTIDGGGVITLNGNNVTRIINHTSGNLTLQNITLTNARAAGAGEDSNGAAIRSHPWPEGGILTVDHVTFTNNYSDLTAMSGNAYDFGGGAIFSIGGVVHVSNCTFTGNKADGGGAAIHVLQSSASVSNSTFTNNSSTGYTSSSQGGAIYIDGLGGPSGYFTITDSTFTGNTTYNAGGAIYVNMYENTTYFSVDRSSFINNAVVGGGRAQGGAITGGSTVYGSNSGNAKITITNSLFSGNTAGVNNGTPRGSGGALNINQKAVTTIANNTFVNNRAQGQLNTEGWDANGGAIFLISYDQAFRLTNNTFANNYAEWAGGALAVDSEGIAINNLFYNNTADNGGNGWHILQHCAGQLNGSGTANNLQYPPKNPNTNYYNEVVCAPNIIGGTTNVDPLLDALGNNGGPTQTMALLAGSPAIDAGSNTTCAAAPINNLDQRGQPRPIDGDGNGSNICDIGAFEYIPNVTPLAPVLVAPDNGATVSGTTLPLSWQRPGYTYQFRIQVDNNNNFGSPNTDVYTQNLNFTTNYLPPGTYYWRVQALNVQGSESPWSSRSVTLASPANAPLNIHNFNTLPILLTWSPVTWATGYVVQVSTSNTFASLAVPEISADASTLAAAIDTLPNGVYYWRVGAKQGGETAKTWSAVETFTVGVP